MLPVLARAGYPIVAVCARRMASARAAGGGLRRVRATTSPVVAAREARLLLLALPDREIGPVARRLAGARGIDWHGRVVVHHAGALGLEPLEPLVGVGAAAGLLHPLQCLGRGKHAAVLLRGSRARVDGDRGGRALARRLARDLGLVPLPLRPGLEPGERAAYHAAASLASNDLLALFEIAVELLGLAGLDDRRARDALFPLARGTLRQIELGGPDAALSGPVARGDVATLSAQLDRLAELAPQAAEVHRLLSLKLASLARADPKMLSALRRPAGRPAARRV